MITMLTGDCRDLLRTLPDESVHCVVTSPPYWGLRDYGVVGQLGMETSLGEYIDVMIDVFREVRRVLRKDGTLWLNLGDSYATSVNGRSAADTKAAGNDDRTFRDKPFSTIGPVYSSPRITGQPGGTENVVSDPGSDGVPHLFRPGNPDKNGGRSNRDGLAVDVGSMLKPKDLCGIPWRVAFALQEDGWWLRQDIIWSKPNPMPESVTDRCTKAHEYLFLLAKSERYYYDAEAIREPFVYSDDVRVNTAYWQDTGKSTQSEYRKPLEQNGRNKRSVWEVTTQPFSEAHFATFPPALIEPCIKAGCPKGCTVLDPFAGAGTTGLVADRLQRNAILIELNPQYGEMSERRIIDDAPLFVEITP